MSAMGAFLETLYGVTTMFNTTQRVIDRTREAKERGNKTILGRMVTAAHVILKKSDYYCPKDTLRLVKSGKVYVRGSDVAPEVSIEYRTPYAVYVHEDLDATHAPPTQAKFLEKAIRESNGDLYSIIVDGQGQKVTHEISVY
jgi:isocitrate dehydrogenase